MSICKATSLSWWIMLFKLLDICIISFQEIIGYYCSMPFTVIIWILIVLTVGFLRLVFYWKPEWMLKATHVKCDLHKAQQILLKVCWPGTGFLDDVSIIVSPVRSTYGGYYGLVVVTPPRLQTLHRSHDNLQNPYRIASIFYM